MAATKMEFVGNPGERPARTRSGVWSKLFQEEFSKNPGKDYEYKNVSSSTAANLRRDYGLDAETHTVEGELHLFVRWDPSKADEIKASYKPKKSKSKSNGSGQTSAPAPAPAKK